MYIYMYVYMFVYPCKEYMNGCVYIHVYACGYMSVCISVYVSVSV